MSFEQWNALAQTIILFLTLLLQAFVFYLAYKQFKRFQDERLEKMMQKLSHIMSRGMGGVYIPGMSEAAGEQLRARVLDALREELQ